MPIQSTSPGVYIVELPSGPPAIPALPTSVAAFIGRAARGPVDVATKISSFREFDRIFGGLWLGGALGYSVRDFFAQGGSTAVVVRVHEPAADDVATIVVGKGASTLTLVAASPGAWGKSLTAVIDVSSAHLRDPRLCNLTVADGATGAVERYRDVSMDPASPDRVDRMLERQSALVRVSGDLPTSPPMALPVVGAAEGGNDGGTLTAANFTAGPDLHARRRGLYALDDVDVVNLIVIPPYTDPGGGRPVTEGGIDDAVLADAIAYAEQPDRGAVVIVDPPPDWDGVADAVAGVATMTTSDHAVLYFPRIRQADPLRADRLGTFAPSGAVAGVMAWVDNDRGVWVAPAGLNANLGGAKGLELALTDAEIGMLNALAVNCLIDRPGAGPVVWGARTRAGAVGHDPEFRYVSVRRTAIHIEQSLRRGLAWTVFEPNNEMLWAQIRAEVGSFLDRLYRDGALRGRPEQSYFVTCDSTTTTPVDVSNGVVNLRLGFAPLQPAEFIVISLELAAGTV